MKGLSILMLNVRSLYPKLDELYIRFHDFDILCFYETWLNKSYPDEMLKMPNFCLFRLDHENGMHNKRGGGLIIYVKKDLSEYASILSDISRISCDLEQLYIVIDKPNVCKEIIGVVYRPPCSKLSESISEMHSDVSKIQDMITGEITILGDLNINYNLRHSASFKLLKSFERDFNLSQIVNASTRITKSTSTCIDLIFTNMEYISNSGTLDVHVSDHLPVFVIKKKEREKTKFKSFLGRSYGSYDKDIFQEHIKGHYLWVDFWEINENDPDTLWEMMLHIIREVADYHCPLRNMKFREDCPEWITRDMVT